MLVGRSADATVASQAMTKSEQFRVVVLLPHHMDGKLDWSSKLMLERIFETISQHPTSLLVGAVCPGVGAWFCAMDLYGGSALCNGFVRGVGVFYPAIRSTLLFSTDGYRPHRRLHALQQHEYKIDKKKMTKGHLRIQSKFGHLSHLR